MSRIWRVCAPLGFAWACGSGGGPTPTPVPSPTVQGVPRTPDDPDPARLLSDDELLTRISLDLRSVRPTLAELERYDGDPAVLDAMIEEFLHDPRFLRRLEDLWAELLQIRIGVFYAEAWAFERQGFSPAVVTDAAAEEPLRMLSWVAEHDLPYSEYVHGNWSMADETLGAIWPVDYPDGATGWQRVSYTDDRPGAGVLSSNGVWWFKGSMVGNLNRGRANFLSRVFLCDDFLERPVPFVPNTALTSPEAMEDAINTDPGCTTCHDTLDPLGGHFFGFWWTFDERVVPELISYYHPERELLAEELSGSPPGWFGRETGGLVNLGDFVSRDPRFDQCFIQHAWELTTRTDADAVPVDLGPVVERFEDSGGQIREAFRAMVKHPAYQGYDERFHQRLVTPDLLVGMIRDLTGYDWTLLGLDLVNSRDGYPLLAGASDGNYVTVAAPTSSITSLLVNQRLAEASARFVVNHDVAEPGARTLFDPSLTFTETTDGPGSDRLRTQLALLHHRLFGEAVAADGPEVDPWVGLWSDVNALTGDPQTTWVVVLSAMLRDPELVVY